MASGLPAENLQARVRGVILMGLSNADGHLVLTTGNKSELATGYSTLYGDSAGGYAPIKDVLEQLDLWWLHFQNSFMRGVLNLKDIVFYVAVIYFFLMLSVKTLEGKRWQ